MIRKTSSSFFFKEKKVPGFEHNINVIILFHFFGRFLFEKSSHWQLETLLVLMQHSHVGLRFQKMDGFVSSKCSDTKGCS